MTITEFLEARIAVEEARAEDMLECLDKSRRLKECTAKRAIIQNWQPAPATGWGVHADGVDVGNWEATDRDVRHLASVYSDHPDYRQEWKP